MQKTKKNVGDKRTKECKGCLNTSEWVCFKCQQQKEKQKDTSDDIEIRIIIDDNGQICGVFTNLLERFKVNVKIIDHRKMTFMEKLDAGIDTIGDYRLIYEKENKR